MSVLVRFLASLAFLFLSSGAFASVVEPGEYRNRLQIGWKPWSGGSAKHERSGSSGLAKLD